MREPRGYPAPDPDASLGRLVGLIVLADGEQLRVTVHCVDRFWERGAAGCTSFQRALARLQEVAAAIGVEGPWPPWAVQTKSRRWISLGPDLGLVVSGYTAVTCLAPRSERSRRSRRK